MHAPRGRLADEARAKDLLRFITCGSVDDGKSTLIGRLLHDLKLIFEDQMSALAEDSKHYGTTGEEIDFALLVDGLEAEREQGITIDVAYRFFTTPRRSFIVADTPGHEQYTRNMATGASNAELAVILVDARKGVLRANSASFADLLHAQDTPCGRGNKQDRSRRLSQGDLRSDRPLIIPLSLRSSALARSCRSRSRPASATMSRRRQPTRRGIDGPTLLGLSRNDRHRERNCAEAVPLPGTMGQPAQSRFPRLCRNGDVGRD